MQGPPGGGGWNPGGGPPQGGWGPPQPQGSAPGQTQSSPGGPAKTVALSQAELASVHGATQPPGLPPASAPGMTPPAAPVYAPAMAQPVDAKPVATNVGLFLGIAWLLVGLLACLATAAAAALMREGDAVAVSYFCVPIAVGGLAAPIGAAITRTQSPAVAIGSPLGCGCATMMVTFVAAIVFYQAIWPSL